MNQIKEVGNQNNNVINSVWKLYKRRWYILFIYSMVSMEQSIIWITFSPISDTAENYYGINDFQINLLLAWGTIIYIPFAFVSSYILKEKRGLRIVSLLGAFLAALGSSIRCLSILFPKKWYALYILTIGQILNAAVGPLVMSSPSKLSATWFGEQERTIATSIATLSNYFGSSVGFIIGPYIIQSYSLPILLIVEGIGSIIILVCIIIYFPEKPPTPPSPSASFSELDNNSFIFELKGLINQKSFILLSIIGGWSSGIYSIWSTMFNQILQPLHYSQIFSGWLGFASSVSGIVGGVILGILSDTILKRKFKIVLIILLSLSSILFFLVYFFLQ
jgi:FLVCR family MFS transporter